MWYALPEKIYNSTIAFYDKIHQFRLSFDLCRKCTRILIEIDKIIEAVGIFNQFITANILPSIKKYENGNESKRIGNVENSIEALSFIINTFNSIGMTRKASFYQIILSKLIKETNLAISFTLLRKSISIYGSQSTTNLIIFQEILEMALSLDDKKTFIEIAFRMLSTGKLNIIKQKELFKSIKKRSINHSFCMDNIKLPIFINIFIENDRSLQKKKITTIKGSDSQDNEDKKSNNTSSIFLYAPKTTMLFPKETMNNDSNSSFLISSFDSNFNSHSNSNSFPSSFPFMNNQKMKRELFLIVDEPVTIQIQMKNPFSIPLTLTDICISIPEMKNCLKSELATIILDPEAQTTMELIILPQSSGQISIDTIRYKIFNCDFKFEFPKILCQILDHQPLLVIHSQKEMACNGIRIFKGEIFEESLKIKNIGRKPISDLKIIPQLRTAVTILKDENQNQNQNETKEKKLIKSNKKNKEEEKIISFPPSIDIVKLPILEGEERIIKYKIFSLNILNQITNIKFEYSFKSTKLDENHETDKLDKNENENHKDGNENQDEDKDKDGNEKITNQKNYFSRILEWKFELQIMENPLSLNDYCFIQKDQDSYFQIVDIYNNHSELSFVIIIQGKEYSISPKRCNRIIMENSKIDQKRNYFINQKEMMETRNSSFEEGEKNEKRGNNELSLLSFDWRMEKNRIGRINIPFSNADRIYDFIIYHSPFKVDYKIQYNDNNHCYNINFNIIKRNGKDDNENNNKNENSSFSIDNIWYDFLIFPIAILNDGNQDKDWVKYFHITGLLKWTMQIKNNRNAFICLYEVSRPAKFKLDYLIRENRETETDMENFQILHKDTIYLY